MNLVKYHNDVNKIKMGTLSERELDLFFSIIFKMKEQNTREVKLEFKELKELSEAKQRGNERLIKSIDGMTDKILALNTKFVLPNGDIEKLNLFERIGISPSRSTITIKTTETFSYMLNDFLDGYTRFDLKHLVGLKSTYSKQVFRLLKQFEKHNGDSWRIFIIEDFKEKIGVPKTYKTSKFNEKILNPIKEELSHHFNNFEVTKLTKSKEVAGRGKKAHYLKFTWDTFETKGVKKEEVKINKREVLEAEIVEDSKALDKAILKAKKNIYVSKSWNKRAENKINKLLKDQGEDFTIKLLEELYINLKQDVKTTLIQYINGIVKNMELEQEEGQDKQNKKTKSVKTPVQEVKEFKKEIKEPINSELAEFKEEVKKIGKEQLKKEDYFIFSSQLITSNTFEKVNKLVIDYSLNKTIPGTKEKALEKMTKKELKETYDKLYFSMDSNLADIKEREIISQTYRIGGRWRKEEYIKAIKLLKSEK